MRRARPAECNNCNRDRRNAGRLGCSPGKRCGRIPFSAGLPGSETILILSDDDSTLHRGTGSQGVGLGSKYCGLSRIRGGMACSLLFLTWKPSAGRKYVAERPWEIATNLESSDHRRDHRRVRSRARRISGIKSPPHGAGPGRACGRPPVLHRTTAPAPLASHTAVIP